MLQFEASLGGQWTGKSFFETNIVSALNELAAFTNTFHYLSNEENRHCAHGRNQNKVTVTFL